MQAFCSSAPVAKDWRSCFWRCFSARFSGLRQQVNVYQCWSKQPWPWWCQGLRLQKLNRNTSQSPSGSTQVRRGRLGRCWHGCRGATEGKETNTLYCIAKFMTLIVFLWLSPCGFWPRIATPNSMRTFRSLSFFAHISTGWIAILGQRSHSTKDSYRTTLFPRFLLWNNNRRLAIRAWVGPLFLCANGAELYVTCLVLVSHLSWYVASCSCITWEQTS